MPIEVIDIGGVNRSEVTRAVMLTNRCQGEFRYFRMQDQYAVELRRYAFRNMTTDFFLKNMEDFRRSMRGFHPFMIAFVDAPLKGKHLGNLFGSSWKNVGLAVVTTANVPDHIIPCNLMVAYFVYYLARYTLSFVCPNHKNHDETRNCVFDHKIQKLDILKSMGSRALCDKCRESLLSGKASISGSQMEALEAIVSLSGKIISGKEKNASLPTAFIGSSSEGLKIAHKLAELLRNDLDVIVWDQGTVFGLGDATLEALENAVNSYDFGLFVFTPDDKLHSRGKTQPVARDNVVFELGLFIGKLGRRRAFLIHPSHASIALPSDLHGITTADYDPKQKDLEAAMETVCKRIRTAVADAELQ